MGYLPNGIIYVVMRPAADDRGLTIPAERQHVTRRIAAVGDWGAVFYCDNFDVYVPFTGSWAAWQAAALAA